MNWFEKHLGDWAKKTQHLTMVEEGAYNRLCDWCYAHERALPLLEKDVFRVARCANITERKAVQRVLREFFSLQEDGWHNSRVDREIVRFVSSRPASAEARAATNDRKRRSRERRSVWYSMLREAGVNVPWNAPNSELQRLAALHNIVLPMDYPEPVTASGHGTVTATRHGMVTRDMPEEVTATGHGSRESTTHIPGHAVTGHGEPLAVTGSRAGLACKAMRRAGLADVNPADPRLLALLDAGVSDDEFAMVAAEASARRKGWAWVLATIAGRRNDAAQMAATMAGRPEIGPPSHERNAAEAWAPAAATKRLAGPL